MVTESNHEIELPSLFKEKARVCRSIPFVVGPNNGFAPDITSVVDWALKIKYPSIYQQNPVSERQGQNDLEQNKAVINRSDLLRQPIEEPLHCMGSE